MTFPTNNNVPYYFLKRATKPFTFCLIIIRSLQQWSPWFRRFSDIIQGLTTWTAVNSRLCVMIGASVALSQSQHIGVTHYHPDFVSHIGVSYALNQSWQYVQRITHCQMLLQSNLDNTTPRLYITFLVDQTLWCYFTRILWLWRS